MAVTVADPVPFTARYVRSVDDPDVLLDISAAPYCLRDGWSFGAPDVRGQSRGAESLRDGDPPSSTTLGDATVNLPLSIEAATETALHAALDDLAYHVNRDGVLEVTFGDAAPRYLIVRRGSLAHQSTAVTTLSRPTIQQDRSPYVYGQRLRCFTGKVGNTPIPVGGNGTNVFATDLILGEAPTPAFIVKEGEWTTDSAAPKGVFLIHNGGSGSGASFNTEFAPEEFGSLGADTTAVASGDATMVNGSYLRTSFATVASYARRANGLTDMPADGSEGGRVRVYAFVRSTAAGGVYDLGFIPVSQTVITPQVRWTSPNANVRSCVDLGVIQLPPQETPPTLGEGDPMVIDGEVYKWCVGRVSGAGSLDLDYIAFAPVDRQSAVVRIPQEGTDDIDVMFDADSNAAYPVSRVGTDADPTEIRARSYSAELITDAIGAFPMLEPGYQNFIGIYKPRVMPAASAWGDIITDWFECDIYYRPRYLSVR